MGNQSNKTVGGSVALTLWFSGKQARTLPPDITFLSSSSSWFCMRNFSLCVSPGSWRDVVRNKTSNQQLLTICLLAWQITKIYQKHLWSRNPQSRLMAVHFAKWSRCLFRCGVCHDWNICLRIEKDSNLKCYISTVELILNCGK